MFQKDMSKKYDPKSIEGKWQKEWEEKGVYKTTETKDKPKFYVLDMFPYPSGEGLHVGHPKGYIATDVVSRMKRMQGFNVLHPMGFDAFGLPAEQYAIKMKVNPAVAVAKNVERYKKQLEILGFDYDWSREVITTDPKYYKWTQWIFLKLLEKGLAEERYEPINWCPVDKTGLANEDIEDGKCERCGATIEKRLMKQWVLKITDYADRMLADLDATDYVMPELVDNVNPPQENKSTVERKNAHAIVYDPKTAKYLIIRNAKFGWDTVIIGGIEEGEDAITAARREIIEETGYTDFEFKRILGGEVKASYFAKHKDVNRVAYSTAVYFELKSDKRIPINDADDADKANEIVWVDEVDFVPGKMVNSELPIWLSRLNADVIIDPKTGVVGFKDTSPLSSVQPDKPFVERNAIAAVVKHWEEDKYLALQWKKVSWRTLVTGGPEGDESAEDGARREIIEETGFQNPVLVRKLGNMDSIFYHNPKGVNRVGHFDVFYFELKDSERKELTEEESANHEIAWLTKEEMETFLTPSAQKYIWHTLFLNKKDSHFLPGKPLLDWPESIKESQRNWIGRSEGAEIDFKINQRTVTVFTTRADTLFGVTYLVLAPEHSIVKNLLESVSNKSDVEVYIQSAKAKTEIDRTDATKEKTGVELKGIKAINPATKEEIPVWIADYVLADYGTGAVMAVPAHDERDWDFAKEYNLPTKRVLAWETGIKRENEERRDGGCAVIFDPKTQKYAFGKLPEGNYDLYGGGVDANEDLQKGILREVEEESGLHDFSHAEIIDDAFVHYHNSKKNVNRVARATCMLLILNTNSAKNLQQEIHEDYELTWAQPEEIIMWWKNNNENHDYDHWVIFLEKGIARSVELGFDTTNKKYKDEFKAYTGEGSLINSTDVFEGLSSDDARKKITMTFGRAVTKYKLRDWVFSRQRYWGEPIPVSHDESGKVIPLSENDLPLELPAVEHYEPTDTGESPLANITEWVNFEKDGEKFKRETNTMPQWAGSSWYYLRYMDPNNDQKLVDPAKEKYWNSVDLYVGGAEHATRHLIYARFWHKFLYDIGVVSTIEPFAKLQSVGLIVASDGRKMSKRWGNVVNPDEIVDTFGADAMRLYEMFMGPFEQAIAWNTNGLVGTRRFIERVWNLRKKVSKDAKEDVSILLNQTIKKVTEDIADMKFNTAVSSLMILVNELDKHENVHEGALQTLLLLLAPFAPHVTEELWYELGHKTSIHLAPWPSYDPTKLQKSTVTIAISINGKSREVMTVPADLGEDEAKETALAMEGVTKWIGDKEIKKVVYVKNRILNFIID